MNIEIKRPIINDDKADNAKWDLQMKSAYRSVLLSFLIGCVFEIIYYFNSGFKVLESIGSILIILSISGLVNIFRSRDSYKNRYEKIRKLPAGTNTELRITIEDLLFKYETFEIKQEFRWSVFRHYKLVEDMLFLLTGDNYLASYVIYKNELTEQQFQEFYGFLSRIFPEKK